MSSVKILWVNDEYEGPMNGIAEYNGEKVWFSRSEEYTSDVMGGAPKIISSTNIPVPEIVTVTNNIEANSSSMELHERFYSLCRLNDDDMNMVTAEHIARCEETGAPVNHGDPLRIKRRPRTVKMDISAAILEGETSVEFTKRPLGKVTIYNHKIDTSRLNGEHIAIVKETEISNYAMPRAVEMI